MNINDIKSISFRKKCVSKILFSILAVIMSIIWLCIVISMHIFQKKYYGYEMYKNGMVNYYYPFTLLVFIYIVFLIVFIIKKYKCHNLLMVLYSFMASILISTWSVISPYFRFVISCDEEVVNRVFEFGEGKLINLIVFIGISMLITAVVNLFVLKEIEKRKIEVKREDIKTIKFINIINVLSLIYLISIIALKVVNLVDAFIIYQDDLANYNVNWYSKIKVDNFLIGSTLNVINFIIPSLLFIKVIKNIIEKKFSYFISVYLILQIFVNLIHIDYINRNLDVKILLVLILFILSILIGVLLIVNIYFQYKVKNDK